MKNALLNLQSQLKVAAPKVEEAQPSINYGKGDVQIQKSNKKLSNFRKKLRKQKNIGEKSEQQLLTKVNLEKLSEQALIASPISRYTLNLKNELRNIQRENKAKITHFRREQIKNQNNPNPSKGKQYLTFKTFFETLEKAKDQLKVSSIRMQPVF